jgi:hypothetical protein
VAAEVGTGETPLERTFDDQPPKPPDAQTHGEHQPAAGQALPTLADEQAAVVPDEKATPPVEPVKPKRSRKVQRTKKLARPKTLKALAAALRNESPRSRNVPAFLEMIDRLNLKPAQPVSIHFDDIRQKCHLEKDVDNETIKTKTLIPAQRAIVVARLPYRVKKSGHYAIVQKIPPKSRRKGPA